MFHWLWKISKHGHSIASLCCREFQHLTTFTVKVVFFPPMFKWNFLYFRLDLVPFIMANSSAGDTKHALKSLRVHVSSTTPVLWRTQSALYCNACSKEIWRKFFNPYFYHLLQKTNYRRIPWKTLVTHSSQYVMLLGDGLRSSYCTGEHIFSSLLTVPWSKIILVQGWSRA